MMTYTNITTEGAAQAYRRAREDAANAVLCAQLACISGGGGVVAAIAARPGWFIGALLLALACYLSGIYFLRSARRYEAVRRAILFRDRVVGQNCRRGANVARALPSAAIASQEEDEVRPSRRLLGTKRRADNPNPRAL